MQNFTVTRSVTLFSVAFVSINRIFISMVGVFNTIIVMIRSDVITVATDFPVVSEMS